jgi:hypothetical protein
MPYIKKENREKLDPIIHALSIACLKLGVTGNLNYILYKLALRNCRSYTQYAAFIGELEAAKLEIYRRQIAPYEELKIEENGDIEE